MADVLRFDIAKDPKGNPIVYGRVGDSNGLTRKVKVFDDGKPFDLTGWTTTFEGNTSKYKTKVFDSEGITVDDPTKGEFSYVFPNMAFAVEGQYERAYFSFTKNGIRRSSGDFEIIVFGNADINAAEAETVITEYNKLVAELQELQKNNIADLQEQQDTYIQSTDNTFAAIQGRITNLQNTIKGFETSADEVAETIQTRLSELAKRLDELELGVRLHDAYAWSVDGTDRFTTVYPGENLILGSSDFSSGIIGSNTVKLTGADGYNGHTVLKTTVRSDMVGGYIDSWSYKAYGVTKKGKYTLCFKAKASVNGAALTSFFYNPSTTTNQVNSQGRTGTSSDGQSAFSLSTEWKDYWVTWTQGETESAKSVVLGRCSKSTQNIDFYITEPTFVEGDTPTIYTPAPSEDPINAYPSYKGISIVDSDNPADYSWQAEDNTIAKKATLDSHTENISNPHKVTKTQIELGNVDNYATANQTDAEQGLAGNKFITPMGVKQHVDSRMATQAEAEKGESNTEFMTPFTTKKFYLNETKVRRQRWEGGINYIAHRGSNADFPENSIPAFKAAARHWGIETDIQVTADGQWVIMHDATVDRTTNGTGAVASKTLAQFRALRLDSGKNLAALTDAEKIPPTLEEYLLVCRTMNKVPIIEIKDASYSASNYDLLQETLTRFGYDEENCVIISFGYSILEKIRAMYPNMELHYLVNETTNDTLNQAMALGIPAAISSAYTSAGVTEANISLMHTAGFKFSVWTVPDSQFDRLTKMGIDYITTDSKSGNLRWATLSPQNGFTFETNVALPSNYVEELTDGSIHVHFVCYEGSNTRGTTITTLPEWAVPLYQKWMRVGIRTSAGTSDASVDVIGKISTEKQGAINVSYGWDQRSTWASADLTFSKY